MIHVDDGETNKTWEQDKKREPRGIFFSLFVIHGWIGGILPTRDL